MDYEKEDEYKKEIAGVITEYSDMLFRICFLILKNEQDTQDVLQDTFIKYMEKKPKFASEELRKAWLITVSQNKCRDFLRFHKRHQYVELSCVEEILQIEEISKDIDFKLFWKMKASYKTVIILHYIEGYSVKEIAGMLKITENAVKKRLQRGRMELKELLDEQEE